jgi:hypothetical protein
MSCALVAGVGGAVKEGGDKCEPKPVPSFIKVHAAFRTVIFYTHNISECDEQNVLNLELALFHLKCKVFIKELLTEFFIKKSFGHKNFKLIFVCYFCRLK